MRLGFTLLEIILSFTVLALIVGGALVVSRTLIINADLDGAAIGFTQSIRRAQMLARGSDGDSQWGVLAQSGSIILFKGASFASRDTSYDETASVPTTVAPSGTTEFVFSKLTGLPSASGTLTLTGLQSQSRTITVNAKGTVSY